MNINEKRNIPKNKNRTYSKKELLNSNNKIKLINLILSKKPISPVLNLKNNNINLSSKINVLGEEYSLKNSCFKKSKVLLANNLNNIKKMKVQDFSNYKNLKGKNNIKNNINTRCKNLKKSLKNKSFYLINKCSYEIPCDNISYIKKKKYILKNQKSESIKKLKTKSISISRNFNMNGHSFERKKNSSLFGDIKSFLINENIQMSSKYLNKIKRNYSQDLKYKITLFVKQRKFKNSRKILKFSNVNNIKSSKKSYRNIITNNSDKENTDYSTKKNNLTTHGNNMPYFTTNFNNSTNISETNNNNEFQTENKICKKKKLIKKKLGLPFHPNYKKVEYYKQMDSKNNLLKRNNKSEIYIPYNKKNNKICRIKSGISPFNNYRIKLGEFNINNSARNKKNKNDSFFDIYSSINSSNYRGNYIHNSFDSMKKFNKSYVEKNNNIIGLIDKNIEKEKSIYVELVHFRIVSFIQENKKILNLQEK